VKITQKYLTVNLYQKGLQNPANLKIIWWLIKLGYKGAQGDDIVFKKIAILSIVLFLFSAIIFASPGDRKKYTDGTPPSTVNESVNEMSTMIQY